MKTLRLRPKGLRRVTDSTSRPMPSHSADDLVDALATLELDTTEVGLTEDEMQQLGCLFDDGSRTRAS